MQRGTTHVCAGVSGNVISQLGGCGVGGGSECSVQAFGGVDAAATWTTTARTGNDVMCLCMQVEDVAHSADIAVHVECNALVCALGVLMHVHDVPAVTDCELLRHTGGGKCNGSSTDQ